MEPKGGVKIIVDKRRVLCVTCYALLRNKESYKRARTHTHMYI